MPITELRVKGLAPGWKILQLARATNNPRDAFVLCQRELHQPNGHNYVTWYANLVEGGCSSGHYIESLSEATDDFNKRKRTLR